MVVVMRSALDDALTGAQRGILARLRDSSVKIQQQERHLAAERRRRDLLLLKGTTSGLSTRFLGAAAEMSSPAVTYATRRARAAIERGRLTESGGDR